MGEYRISVLGRAGVSFELVSLDCVKTANDAEKIRIQKIRKAIERLGIRVPKKTGLGNFIFKVDPSAYKKAANLANNKKFTPYHTFWSTVARYIKKKNLDRVFEKANEVHQSCHGFVFEVVVVKW